MAYVLSITTVFDRKELKLEHKLGDRFKKDFLQEQEEETRLASCGSRLAGLRTRLYQAQWLEGKELDKELSVDLKAHERLLKKELRIHNRLFKDARDVFTAELAEFLHDVRAPYAIGEQLFGLARKTHLGKEQLQSLLTMENMLNALTEILKDLYTHDIAAATKKNYGRSTIKDFSFTLLEQRLTLKRRIIGKTVWLGKELEQQGENLANSIDYLLGHMHHLTELCAQRAKIAVAVIQQMLELEYYAQSYLQATKLGIDLLYNELLTKAQTPEEKEAHKKRYAQYKDYFTAYKEKADHHILSLEIKEKHLITKEDKELQKLKNQIGKSNCKKATIDIYKQLRQAS